MARPSALERTDLEASAQRRWLDTDVHDSEEEGQLLEKEDRRVKQNFRNADD